MTAIVFSIALLWGAEWYGHYIGFIPWGVKLGIFIIWCITMGLGLAGYLIEMIWNKKNG